MKKILLRLAILGLLGVANISYSEEIPEGLKKLVEQLQTDSMDEHGFVFMRKLRFIDNDASFDEWYVGAPIRYYLMDDVAVENADENSNIMGLITPIDRWRIPIKVGSHYTCHVLAVMKDGKFKNIGNGTRAVGFNVWDKVRKKYPEESGIRPILIGIIDPIIYFPNIKTEKNIFVLRISNDYDELSKITSRDFNSLDEEKIIVKYWIDNLEKNRAQNRKFWKKHPNFWMNPREAK